MRKRLASLFAVTIGLLLSLGILTACRLQQEPDRFPISFYDDTQLVDVVETSGNERIRLPEASEKEGYIFCGWFFDRDSWQEQLTEDTYADRALTAAVDVYAYYRQEEPSQPESPATYTVTFETNGGTAVAPVTTSLIESEPKTSQSGYTFLGWYTESGFVNKAEFPYEVTKAQTLYAKWEKNKYTVTFETNGGTAVAPVTTSLIESEPKTSQSGYTFSGWYTESSFVNKAEFPYEVTKAQTLYAKWEKNKYTVTFETNGGTVVAPVTTSLIESEPKTSQSGYTFSGWYTESSFVNKAEFPYEVTKAQTLYAKWEKNKYTVTFETNGGTAVAPVTTSLIESEPKTSQSGYTFLGWYTESSFVNKAEFPYEVTKTQTLYAKWEKNAPESIVFTVDKNGVLTGVSGISAQTARVEVPSEVNGITVTEIAKDVFKDNREIEALILPDTVRTLGYRMCSGCSALKELRLPSGLTVIPDEAFADCVSLKAVVFPDTLVQIRSDAFSGSGLTEFIAPRALASIWLNAFMGCRDLEKIDLGQVQSIRSGAFQDCTALKAVKIPETVVSLTNETYIFGGCTSLKTIDMPDNPVPISYTLLNGSGYYNDPANWENGVLYVDGYLVDTNDTFLNVTEYAVRERTIVIADNAFYTPGYGSKLKTLSLPQSLRHIGKAAFSKCVSLAEIDMKDGIRSIGYNAFAGTVYEKNEKNWTDNGLYLGNWLIAVKKVSMTSFTVREGTVGVADANDENADSLFPSLARKITSLTLPSSLKYIGVRSFARTQITEVTLPKGLLQIGKGAFYSCSFLQNVNLGDCASLESIGDMAFQECMIGEIAIPESVTKMGELVFNHNTVDLTIRCAVSEKPEGWDSDWAYSYRQGVTVTVEWKKA